jgi:hypothetical protein
MPWWFKFLFIILLPLSGCDKEKEKVPAYLHITACTLVSNPPTQGLNTSDFTAVQVIINGQLLGNFEVPVNVPVLMQGTVAITLVPLIKENASVQSFKPYRVVDPFRDTIELVPLRTDTLKPVLQYRNNCKFVWIEDFDDQSLALVKTGVNTTNDSLLILPMSSPGVDAPFSGSQYCGYIEMAPGPHVKILERSTFDQYSLPNLDRDVYVEMDVKTNTGIQIGIYADDGSTLIQTPVLAVFSTNDKWKKIYVNLKPETGFLSSSTKVRVFFAVFHDGAADASFVSKTYVDNLKLLHLQ